jgi:hypothetical protein
MLMRKKRSGNGTLEDDRVNYLVMHYRIENKIINTVGELLSQLMS